MAYDNSQISEYQKCPMSYYLKYEQCLVRNINDDAGHKIQFGEYFHKFLQEFYQPTGKNFEQIISDYIEPEEKTAYSIESLKSSCMAYAEKYSADRVEFTMLEVEKVSKCKVANSDFVVKKDGAFKHRDNVFGIEHKTTGSMNVFYFDKFMLSSQISAQCYDILQKYGQCSGILINVCEVKLLKRRPTSAYERVLQTEDGYLVCRFTREFINRTKEELEDWYNNTANWIHKIEESKSAHFWPKATGSYGGSNCAKCQFKELCKLSCGTKLNTSILEELYDTTDPFDYLKETEKCEDE